MQTRTKGNILLPLYKKDGIHFISVHKNSLYFLITTRENVSFTLMTEILNRIIILIKDYIGILNEESVRKNQSLIYELLDEIFDYGLLQCLSTSELKFFMLNDPIEIERQIQTNFNIFQITGSNVVSPISSIRPIQTTKFKKNEIFVDIIEKLNVTIHNNQVTQSEILGIITMKSYLQGRPKISLSLNEDLIIKNLNSSNTKNGVFIDAMNFSSFVEKESFLHNRILKMNPPDGEFTILNYRVVNDFRVPFKFSPMFEVQESRIQFIIKLIADFDKDFKATNVMIRIPIPTFTHTVSVDFQEPKNNTYEFKTTEKVIYWGIKEIVGQSEETCKIKINLLTKFQGDIKRHLGPLTVKFEMPMFNVSGLKMRYLKVEERGEDYNPQKWIRYITQSSSYVYRI